MKHDNSSEIFPIVTESGEVIGSATRGKCHDGSKLLHPVVHLHIFDAEGGLYLQKRPEWKDIQPGKWDTAVGGHVDYGEDVAEALVREAREEVGIDVVNPVFLKKYVFESQVERELVNAYMIVTDCTPTPSDELAGGRFWTRNEIMDNIGNGTFTPNFEREYMMLFSEK
ncbi:MAG: NUDIX domain-containing protein [Muribaculaceae bacterium]|nr:NUDIX domain-containing protein [Muribaculaceae bacterium]